VGQVGFPQVEDCRAVPPFRTHVHSLLVLPSLRLCENRFLPLSIFRESRDEHLSSGPRTRLALYTILSCQSKQSPNLFHLLQDIHNRSAPRAQTEPVEFLRHQPRLSLCDSNRCRLWVHMQHFLAKAPK